MAIYEEAETILGIASDFPDSRGLVGPEIPSSRLRCDSHVTGTHLNSELAESEYYIESASEPAVVISIYFSDRE